MDSSECKKVAKHMLNGSKHNQERQTTLKTYIITKETTSHKRSSSQLSPSVEETSAKKANMSSDTTKVAQNTSLELVPNPPTTHPIQCNGTTTPIYHDHLSSQSSVI